MQYAVTKQTAAEIIYDRTDAERPHMGLTTWIFEQSFITT